MRNGYHIFQCVLSLLFIMAIPSLVSASDIKGEDDLKPEDTAKDGTSFIEIELNTQDGLVLKGTYFPPKHNNAPVVILMHMLSRNRGDWSELVPQLRESGYAVLAYDARGHGDSVVQNGTRKSFHRFSPADYQDMINDVQAAYNYLIDREEVDNKRIGLVGASIGANLALNFAARRSDIATLILISPGLDYRGIKTEEAITDYGARPVLFVTAKKDSSSAQAVMMLNMKATGKKETRTYSGNDHGTHLLGANKGLEKEIIKWLNKTL